MSPECCARKEESWGPEHFFETHCHMVQEELSAWATQILKCGIHHVSAAELSAHLERDLGLGLRVPQTIGMPQGQLRK